MILYRIEVIAIFTEPVVARVEMWFLSSCCKHDMLIKSYFNRRIMGLVEKLIYR